MEDSQKLVNRIQRKDRIQRIIANIIWFAIVIEVGLTSWYMINRINAFERTIDCKLLIIPEDRSKAKFIECSELNAQQLIESPVKKEPEILKKDSPSNKLSKPFETYYPLSPITKVIPNTSPKSEVEGQVSVDIPTNPLPKKYEEQCVDGILKIKYEDRLSWQSTGQTCVE